MGGFFGGEGQPCSCFSITDRGVCVAGWREVLAETFVESALNCRSEFTGFSPEWHRFTGLGNALEPIGCLLVFSLWLNEACSPEV